MPAKMQLRSVKYCIAVRAARFAVEMDMMSVHRSAR